MKKVITGSLIIIALFSCTSTKKTTTSAESKPKIDCTSIASNYNNDVMPILQNSCVSCHSKGHTPGGYDFSLMDDINRAAKNGDLLGVIKWQHGYPKMPANAEKLDEASIAKIECWITNGFKNNE